MDLVGLVDLRGVTGPQGPTGPDGDPAELNIPYETVINIFKMEAVSVYQLLATSYTKN